MTVETEIKVSVIIPVFNGEGFLENTINSIQSQTLKEIEVIFVNDASSDSSLNILQSYATKDDRIVIINHLRNEGAAISRNDGLRRARGRYVIFLDSDDFFYEDLLEVAYFHAEECQADVSIVGSENVMLPSQDVKKFYPFVGMQGGQYKLLETDVQRLWYLCEARHVPWDKLVRRELLLQYDISFQNVQANNDIYYSFSVLMLAKRVVLCNKILVRYFWRRQGSLTEFRTHKQNYMVDAFELVYLTMKRRGMNSKFINTLLNIMVDNVQMYLSNRNNIEVVKNQVKDRFLECVAKVAEMNQKENDDILYPHNRCFLEYLLSGGDVCNIEYMQYYKESIAEIITSARKQQKSVALWGYGERGKQLHDLLSDTQTDVDYIIDQKMHNRNEEYKNPPIYHYDEIKEDVDIILITNIRFQDEIQKIASDKEVLYVWK